MIAPRKWSVAQAEPLMEFLLGTLGLKRTAAKQLLKFGALSVNGVVVRRFDHPLTPGDEVTCADSRATAAKEKLSQARVQIVFEDDAFVVVDKPSGLLTVATNRQNTDTLFVRLNEFFRGRSARHADRAYVVHRLDQETSGLVVFAKCEAVKQSLQANWPQVEKTYLAVVRGKPSEEHDTITSYLSESEKSLQVTSGDRPRPGAHIAVTHYRVLQTAGHRSLLEIKLETGRKHQIRVHLADLGCPVVGDRRYGKGSQHVRLALHASQLRFSHPLSGETMVCKSSLPRKLHQLLS